MQTKINPNIDNSLKEIRYNLVKIRKAAKKDTWTLEERQQMLATFEKLGLAVNVLKARCGLA
jgi:hypothetical protein